jgi:hypothetical protein
MPGVADTSEDMVTSSETDERPGSGDDVTRSHDDMDRLKPPVRWLNSHWDEDVLFFFEADEDGWVLRQVELCGPDRTPTVAASLAEWARR